MHNNLNNSRPDENGDADICICISHLYFLMGVPKGDVLFTFLLSCLSLWPTVDITIDLGVRTLLVKLI